jgi:hypothetical protein
MYVVPPHQTSVTLFGRDGSVRPFKTRRDALRALGAGFIRDHVGRSFDVPRPGYGAEFYDPSPEHFEAYRCRYVLIDDTGEALSIHDFSDLRPARAYRYRFGEYGVQHRGRKRSGYSRWRHPRTTAERRQNSLVLHDEREPPVRCPRLPGTLTNTWDDVHRHVERNWKSQRKTQARCGADRHGHPRNGGCQ